MASDPNAPKHLPVPAPGTGDPLEQRAPGGLRDLLFRLRRRLLFLWVRPTFLGTDAQSRRLDGTVCYVLPSRSITDLMVVDEGCIRHNLPRAYLNMPGLDEERSFFFLNRPEGFWGRRSARHTSSRMQRLLDAARNGTPVDIVPVTLFWGHQPDREQSMFSMLFSENWAATSRIRKLMALLFYPNHILVQYSRPIRLSELIRTEADPRVQERKLLRLLRTHNARQRRAILGPDLSHRRTLIDNIITSNAVQQAIEAAAGANGVPRRELVDRARQHAGEIVSHQSYRVVRFFDVLLTWLWNRLYDGIDVHRIGQVKELAESNEIVYIPCHRSHIDYLLLSYVLYHNGLTPPHIAAGRNLNLPVVGPLLRRAGAFFMRRSFQGDSLYRAVFDEYIHLMFIKGYSVEYFIEGGRSRTGRMLKPKAGMLSMTIRSLQRNASLPIVLMPVYIGYERIIEGATYLGELRGRAKRDESVLDVMRATRALKGPYGRVSVSFGEPLDLSSFLDDALPNWTDADNVSPGQFSAAAGALSRSLATRINAAAAVTPVNLLATALLSAPRQTMEADQLLRQLTLLASIAARTRIDSRLTVTHLPAGEVLAHAALVVGMEPQRHEFGELWRASEDQSILLTYYRNNTVHAFIVPALVARHIVVHGPSRAADVAGMVGKLAIFIETECFVALTDPHQRAEQCLDALEQQKLVERTGDLYTAAEGASSNHVALLNLSRIAAPMLERFHIVNTLIEAADAGVGPDTVSDLESEAAAVARRLSAIYGLNSPSFFDQSLFTAYLGSLRHADIVHVSAGRVSRDESHARLARMIAEMIDADVRYQVANAASQRVAGTTDQPALT